MWQDRLDGVKSMKGKRSRKKSGLSRYGALTRPFDTGFHPVWLAWEHPILEARNSPELCTGCVDQPLGTTGFWWTPHSGACCYFISGETGREHVDWVICFAHVIELDSDSA